MIYPNSVATPSDVLTDYVNQGATDATQFKGLQIAPSLPVSSMTATYPKITVAKGDLMRAANRRRAPGSNFNRWQMAIESGSLTLHQVGEEQSIPDEVAMEWDDYFDVEAIGADEALNRLRRGHEIEVESELMNSSTFTAANSSVAYSTVATANFIKDFLAARRTLMARGVVPNAVVIPGLVMDWLMQSTLLKEFLVGTQGAGVQVTDDSLQRALARYGIQSVIIPDSYVNQSDTGSDAVINPIWDDDHIFVGKLGSGNLRSAGALATAYWDKAGPLFNVSTYRDETKKSNIVRDESISEVVVTNTRAGVLITTQIV